MSPRTGIAALAVIATIFGANHVAARLAIDHGASVAAAVTVRSALTALVLLALIKAMRVPFAIDRQTTVRAMLVGVLVAIQSYFLYSSVARIPVALALLVFNIHPMLFMLLSGLTGKERLRGSALGAMALALIGLAVALDVGAGGLAQRWEEIGPGVLFALGAGMSFTLVVFCNAHWLKAIDGRVRTLLMMGVTAVLVCAGGAAAGSLSLPADATGWVGLLLLTLFYGTAITSLFLVLPKLGGGASSTIALNFEPIATLGIAWLVLGQAISALQVAGSFVVVGAIAWLGMQRR